MNLWDQFSSKICLYGICLSMHKMAMMSFAITVYGHCCWRHVVGQRVVNDNSVVRVVVAVFVACVTICYYAYSSIYRYTERLFCFTYQTQLDLQHCGVYLVIMDTEFRDIAATACCRTESINRQLSALDRLDITFICKSLRAIINPCDIGQETWQRHTHTQTHTDRQTEGERDI